VFQHGWLEIESYIDNHCSRKLSLDMRKMTVLHKRRIGLARRRGAFCKCEVCNKRFWRKPYDIAKGNNRFCSKQCYFGYQKGKPKNLSNRHSYIGIDNPNWKGGITQANQKLRHGDMAKEWRLSVFKRDNWTCKKCGKRSRANRYLRIEAHHVKPFALFPELRLVIDNGLTLCKKCHDREPKGKEVYAILTGGE